MHALKLKNSSISACNSSDLIGPETKKGPKNIRKFELGCCILVQGFMVPLRTDKIFLMLLESLTIDTTYRNSIDIIRVLQLLII